MPLTPGVPEMLRRLKNEIGAKFVIVSDANAVFIREPLKNANLFDLFEKIYTNPAEFDDQGRLNMTPFTEQVCPSLIFMNYDIVQEGATYGPRGPIFVALR
jgi:pyridoxal phosphate phosphatase PHOSPHO2